MTGFFTVSLSSMIDALGESTVVNILSSFSCPKNKDVENFLKSKSIIFSKQGISKTHLVFTSYKEEPVLIGYFALAPKYIVIKKGSLSKTLQKRISKFAIYDPATKEYRTAASLIGQLGKNFTNNYNTLITGNELLKMAIDKIAKFQQEIGGKITYLECEDNQNLLDFYKRNGFVTFGKRILEKDETDTLKGEYLIQMLKYS